MEAWKSTNFDVIRLILQFTSFFPSNTLKKRFKTENFLLYLACYNYYVAMKTEDPALDVWDLT